LKKLHNHQNSPLQRLVPVGLVAEAWRQAMDKDVETFFFAPISGDTVFLQFIRDRLVNVYGENPNMDYILTLETFIKNLSPLLASYAEYHESTSARIDKISAKLDQMEGDFNERKLDPTGGH
jgi:muramidase (phage lysozyme)